jgi:NAD(P)H-hydrate epimerase
LFDSLLLSCWNGIDEAWLTTTTGFSFTGTTIREPFGAAITALASTRTPVLSVDAPSAWDVERGPPAEGPAAAFRPAALISLTAPKPLVRWFHGRHFIGGRYVSL